MRFVRHILFRVTCALLAVNFVSFHAEFDKDEYERNHPSPSDRPSITYSCINWETFDKCNAPKAFVFNAEETIQLFCFHLEPPRVYFPLSEPFEEHRGRAPPPTQIPS